MPSPLKVRLTIHSPVETPVEVVRMPAVASEMSPPCTSTGPRRYFSCPYWSHVMRGSAEGAALAVALSSWSQLKASYCSCSSGVTHARSEPSVGSAVGVAAGAGVSVASGCAGASVASGSAGASVAAGSAVEPSEGSSVGVTTEEVGAPASSTARKSMRADCLMRSSVA